MSALGSSPGSTPRRRSRSSASPACSAGGPSARPPADDRLVQQTLTRQVEHEPSVPKLKRRAARRLAERVAAGEDAPGEGAAGGRSHDGEIDLLRPRDALGERDAASAHTVPETSGPADEPGRLS